MKALWNAIWLYLIKILIFCILWIPAIPTLEKSTLRKYFPQVKKETSTQMLNVAQHQHLSAVVWTNEYIFIYSAEKCVSAKINIPTLCISIHMHFRNSGKSDLHNIHNMAEKLIPSTCVNKDNKGIIISQ
jgi:hypothetical protein